MLIRRFSTRFLLLLTTAAAVFSLFVSLALRGHAWAFGIVCAAAGLLTAVLCYIACFVPIGLLAERYRQQPPVPQSPFADAAPPKQVIPPLP